MVVKTTTMRWLSDIGLRSGKKTTKAPLGILSFETAKTMSIIISLYKSLSDHEMLKLRNVILKSEGVLYLNSNDEDFLLNLTCAERLEDLDKAATFLARLGQKCSNLSLNRFDVLYTDLKLGVLDVGKLEYASKKAEKKIQKMENLILATSNLYSALEALTELEITERKLSQWKKSSHVMQSQKTNFDLFNQKISFQRRQVHNFRETSLWNQSFDKSVGLMAPILFIVYSRICSLFGPYIPILPRVSLSTIMSSHPREISKIQPESCLIKQISRSGPMPTTSRPNFVRFYSRKSICFSPEGSSFGANNNRVFHAAGTSTVGGSGLATRYANVIILAEKYLDTAMTIDDDAREDLYMSLPESLKTLVRSKLSRNVRNADDDFLAEGWRGALAEIMGWLAPMAHDTLKWQMERSFGKMSFNTSPSVLLLQTLHFSDKEKTEAAIAEVLVGLSCIYWCENRLWYDG
ncbi:uncharacterized protein LOC132293586 [Cornus florida]|uniref:uncharacterized protein LOC132293586 n=1 Tax=Cornus florida TaxID=4283 RepID=UPI00289E3343|nr:uncharacterized protein LOC132293586 [Cornus florida]